jgi:hypothetical protein
VPNPVDLADLEDRWRPLADDEKAGAQALLADAWAIANVQLPNLDASVTAGTTSPDAVRAVLSAMVIRVLRNPDGVRQWSVDDYSETRDSTLSSGALYLTADELNLLNTAMGRPRRGAFSITPGGESVGHSPGSEWPYGFGYGYGSPWR